jgi:hypothetical protein
VRTFLLITAGFVLCLGLLVASGAYSTYARLKAPHGAVVNENYSLVQLVVLGDSDEPTNTKYELKKGESLPLGYGSYAVNIPEAKASFVLFKNSNGSCTIRSAGGTLLVETNGVAQVQSTGSELPW